MIVKIWKFQSVTCIFDHSLGNRMRDFPELENQDGCQWRYGKHAGYEWWYCTFTVNLATLSWRHAWLPPGGGGGGGIRLPVTGVTQSLGVVSVCRHLNPLIPSLHPCFIPHHLCLLTWRHMASSLHGQKYQPLPVATSFMPRTQWPCFGDSENRDLPRVVLEILLDFSDGLPDVDGHFLDSYVNLQALVGS